MKVTTVILVAGNMKREFEIEHAERLLKMPKNGGWQLPKDSLYEMTDNGINFKRDTKKAKGAKTKSDDSESDQA